ncbi:MAG: flippase-like domain-containing protein [Anaerolineaceae bacterium]|nr:flippase-like domain-containing protein [Anaerolineaceae bacterium]
MNQAGEKAESSKSFKHWLPGFAISIVAIVIVLQFIEWEEFKRALGSARLLNLVLLVIFSTIALIFRSLSWRNLLENKASLVQTFLVEEVGYLLNNFLPFRLGELGRAVLMGNLTGYGTFHVLSTVVIERALDMGFAALTMLITLPFIVEADWAGTTAVITMGVVLAGFVAMYLMARYHEWVRRQADKIAEKSKFIQRTIMPLFGSLLDGFAVMTSPKQFLVSLAYQAVCWCCYWGTFYVVIIQFVPEAKLWWSMFVNGVVALGIAVPSAPGSLGVWEASFVGAMAVLGVSQSNALVSALIIHVTNYIHSGIFGFIGLTKFGQSFGNLIKELRIKKDTQEEIE